MPTTIEITDFIGKTLGLKAVSHDSAMGQHRKWDSLNHVKLILALEGEYSAGISPDMVGELVSVHVIPRPHGSLEEVLPIGKSE